MSTGSFSSNLNALAADSRSLDALKLKAGQNSASAIKEEVLAGRPSHNYYGDDVQPAKPAAGGCPVAH